MTKQLSSKTKLAKKIWILSEYMCWPSVTLHHREHEVLLKLYEEFAYDSNTEIQECFESALKEFNDSDEIGLMKLSRLRNYVHEYLKLEGIDPDIQTLQNKECNVSTIIQEAIG